MSADIIQARYDDLAAIAARFGEQAEQSAALLHRVSQCADTLTQEGWEGAGVLAFRAEMDDEVFPALQRLIQALEEGRAVTLEASTILQQAEEEAAALFQGGEIAGVGAAAMTAARAAAEAAARLFEQQNSYSPITDSRSSLSEMQKEYQVQSDNMIYWSPKALGFIPIPFIDEFIDEVKITETEAKLLDRLSFDRGALGLMTFNDIKNQSFDISENQYPNPDNIPTYVPEDLQGDWLGNDGHRDAFRHAYWNALLTKEFGTEWTTQFTTAHEAVPGNAAVREAMDLYNNEVGRQIAINNPNATNEELATLIRQAIDSGEMVVVDQDGSLAWSHQVPVGEHGLANDTPGEGGMPLPEGNASAR
jgi:WXG100 family type VII secretion target